MKLPVLLLGMLAAPAFAQRAGTDEWSLNLLVQGSKSYAFEGGASARNDGGAGANTDWVLELSYTPLDHVDFYVRNGDVVKHVRTGDQEPISEAQLDYHEYAVPIRIPPGEQVQLILRVQTGGGVRDAGKPSR